MSLSLFNSILIIIFEIVPNAKRKFIKTSNYKVDFSINEFW